MHDCSRDFFVVGLRKLQKRDSSGQSDCYGENLILRQLTRASTSLFPPTVGSSMTSSEGSSNFQISSVGAGHRLLNRAINFGKLYQRSNAS